MVTKPNRERASKPHRRRKRYTASETFEWLARVGKELPPEEKAAMPRDGAANFDHYLDQSPKQY
jgi:hypothetical protein